MHLFTWSNIQSFLETGNIPSIFQNGTGLSIGSFDGLHLGHRELLTKLVKGCANQNYVPGVISFSRPLPSIKHSADYMGDVSTLNQRLEIFEELGIQFAIIIDFDEAFASTTGTDFLNILVNACNMKLISEGIDFRFGYKGATDVSAIKYFAQNHQLSTIFVDQIIYKEGTAEEERVSSSFIRQMVKRGFFATVQELLNRPYAIDISHIDLKQYIHGNNINIPVNEITQVLPQEGMYSVTLVNDNIKVPAHLEISNEYMIIKNASSQFTAIQF